MRIRAIFYSSSRGWCPPPACQPFVLCITSRDYDCRRMYLRITRRSLELRPVPFFFVLPLIFIFFLQGCASNSVSVKQDPPAVTISISPTAASVVTTKTQPFTATVTNATNTAVTWQVNGVTGGDSTHGIISASGLYTAPSAVPNPATVTVSAISQADPTKSASATVAISSAPDTTAPTAPSGLTAVSSSATQN